MISSRSIHALSSLLCKLLSEEGPHAIEEGAAYLLGREAERDRGRHQLAQRFLAQSELSATGRENAVRLRNRARSSNPVLTIIPASRSRSRCPSAQHSRLNGRLSAMQQFHAKQKP